MEALILLTICCLAYMAIATIVVDTLLLDRLVYGPKTLCTRYPRLAGLFWPIAAIVGFVGFVLKVWFD